MYNHQSTVRAAIRSPSGRTGTATGYGGSYARAEVSIPLLDAVGNFTTEHETSVFCQAMRMTLAGGGGRSGRNVGVSFVTYEKVHEINTNRALYRVITLCDVTCKGNNDEVFAFLGPPLPRFFIIQEPFFEIAGFAVCESVIRGYRESLTRVECFDVSVPV